MKPRILATLILCALSNVGCSEQNEIPRNIISDYKAITSQCRGSVENAGDLKKQIGKLISDHYSEIISAAVSELPLRKTFRQQFGESQISVTTSATHYLVWIVAPEFAYNETFPTLAFSSGWNVEIASRRAFPEISAEIWGKSRLTAIQRYGSTLNPPDINLARLRSALVKTCEIPNGNVTSSMGETTGVLNGQTLSRVNFTTHEYCLGTHCEPFDEYSYSARDMADIVTSLSNAVENGFFLPENFRNYLFQETYLDP